MWESEAKYPSGITTARPVSSAPLRIRIHFSLGCGLVGTMSVDLDWENLTSELANSLVEILNRQLSSATRPSFIGPIEVLSFEFGNVPPDVEVIDIRNIHPDFLEDDEEQDGDDDPVAADRPVPPTRQDQPRQPEYDYSTQPPGPVEGGSIELEENFEWVPRKALHGKGLEDGPHLQYPPHPLSHLPGGMGRASPRTGVTDMFGSTPSLYHGGYPGSPWSPAMSNILDLRATSYYPPSMAHGLRGSVYGGSMPGSHLGSRKPSPRSRSPNLPAPDTQDVPGAGSDSQPTKREHPNLQLHVHISWESNLRLTLATSLLINYPSPMFMTLPIKVTITGLVFDGQLAVAYQGDKRRVHLCILDELDPYVPSAQYRNRDSGAMRDKSNLNSPIVMSSSRSREDLTSSPAPAPSPLNPLPRVVPLSHQSSEDSIMREDSGERSQKPLPIGQRLLPNIYIESEIGQADKHVLKNVMRVERFIQDVVRKSVVEELVFPNFHTLILGDGS
jgi:distribution and morphology protein 12